MVRFDENGMEAKLTEYYTQHIRVLNEVVDINTRRGKAATRTAMKSRITHQFFSRIAKRKDTTNTTTILKDMLKPRRLRNNSRLAERYTESNDKKNEILEIYITQVCAQFLVILS